MNTSNQCVNESCRAVLKSAQAAFCSKCGRHTSHIQWRLVYGDQSRLIPDDRPKEKERYAVQPGDTVTLRASNLKPVPAKVMVDMAALQGFEYVDYQSWVEVTLDQPMDFVLKYTATDTILGGDLKIISDNGPRDPQRWDIVTTPLIQSIPIQQWLMIRQQRWVASTQDKIYFCPGVNRQRVQFWNDSDIDRTLHWVRPYGYQITPLADSQLSKSTEEISVKAGQTVTLEVIRLPEAAENAQPHVLKVRDSRSVDYIKELHFETLPGKPASNKELPYDAIIAIDFGTRNTSMRIWWIQAANDENRLPDTPYSIGESGRFPSLMICHPNGTIHKWGQEAEEALPKLNPQDNLVVVDDLKTFLREGRDSYPYIEVDTQTLLQNYFDKLIHEIDQVCDGRGARLKKRIQYVVSHPVLDAVSLERYLKALEMAFEPYGISTKQNNLTFIPEPVAAAYEIARKFPEKLRHLHVKDLVAVIDSGGGTTDITVAEVVGVGAVPTLAPRKNGALCINRNARPLNEALQNFAVLSWGNDRQFGGNVLDAVQAFMLTSEGFAYIREEATPKDPRFPIDVDPVDLNQLVSNQDSSAVVTASSVKPPIAKPATEQDRIISLWCARVIKEDVVTKGKKYLYDLIGRNPFPTGEESYKRVYVQDKHYERWVVEEVMRSAIALFRQENQELLKDPVYTLFFVGGTCSDPKIRQTISSIFGLTHQEENQGIEGIRMNAVVEGAVRSEDIKSVSSPISLWLDLNHPDFPKRIPLITQGDQLRPRGQLVFNESLNYLALDKEWLPELWGEITVEESSHSNALTNESEPTPTAFTSDPQKKQWFLLAHGFYNAMQSGRAKLIWAISQEGVEVDAYFQPTGQKEIKRQPLWRLTLTGGNE